MVEDYKIFASFVADDLCGYANSNGVIRQILGHNSICPDSHIIAYPDTSKNFCSRPHKNPIADYWGQLLSFATCLPYGHPLRDVAVFT